MSHTPKIEKDAHLFEISLISIFTAAVILLVRMVPYEAKMDQFLWSKGGTTFSDFFSLFKSQVILVIALLALLVILYRLSTQVLAIRKSAIYIPMIVYSTFVLLSYVFSKHKEFALFGWNDRFEGTLVLLAYMLMLFYIINIVSSEKHVKWIIYPLAVTTTILGFIGISQYYLADFFQTTFGKKLITPSVYWDRLDAMNFNFKGGEIYQTVFNPNYVSFYLTLLVPLFAMLFFMEKNMVRKVLFGLLYGLSLFNLIGSASSNGIAGLAISFVLALVVLNKRLLEWKKPLIFLLLITAVVGSLTFARFLPQITNDVKAVASLKVSAPQAYASEKPVQTSALQATAASGSAPAATVPFAPKMLDYFQTGKDSLTIGISGEQLVISAAKANGGITLTLSDSAGKNISAAMNTETKTLILNDPRFSMIGISQQVNKGVPYLVIQTGDKSWPFAITKEGVLYRNGLGKLLSLTNTPHIGFESNPSFGSYRGYIWSRSLPLLKDTLILGNGADTFCIYFPQNDYAGKYAVGWTDNIIVDKAHNMYLATALNTGVISLLALLWIFGIYIRQSFTLYRKAHYEGFLTFCGSGIFLGISGFLVSGLFNDSSVSVMPLFYGLLGTGFAINRILKRRETAQ